MTTMLEHSMTPEQAALSLIASAVRSGATPDVVLIARTTRLDERLVASLRDRYLSGKRGALERPPPIRAHAVAPGVQPRWEEALTHPALDVQRRARHIADLIAALEEYLANYDADLKLEARLMTQLAEVRARVPRPAAGHSDCPECGETIDNRGLVSHTRSHEKKRKSGEAMPPVG